MNKNIFRGWAECEMEKNCFAIVLVDFPELFMQPAFFLYAIIKSFNYAEIFIFECFVALIFAFAT